MQVTHALSVAESWTLWLQIRTKTVVWTQVVDRTHVNTYMATIDGYMDGYCRPALHVQTGQACSADHEPPLAVSLLVKQAKNAIWKSKKREIQHNDDSNQPQHADLKVDMGRYIA